MGVFILVLMLTLVNLALVSFGELSDFDEDDLGFLDLGTLKPILAHLYFGALVLGFELGVFPTTLRLEYLRSHIGEKRPASPITQVNHSSFRVLFLWTALFSMPSFCLFYAEFRSLNRVGHVLGARSLHLISFKEIFSFYSRRFVTMREWIQLSMYKEKILIQGGM